MSERNKRAKNMVATRNKNKVLIPCSTPEHAESPSRDSDSLCDSESASPVPFICTQDGAEGVTDVIWNYYTPKSGSTLSSRLKNSTPISSKSKKSSIDKLIEKQAPKRRTVKTSQKKTELFQELFELNQNLHELIVKPKDSTPKSEILRTDVDIFNDSLESPKDSLTNGLKTNSRCLRRNVLSSKFSKPEPDNVLESDDSMNECLVKASQAVENILEYEPTPSKRVCYESKSKVSVKNIKPDFSFKINDDSMDAILNSIKVESPAVSKAKKFESPHFKNDSFDSFVGNLNDSALEQLTQMPIKNKISNKITEESDWKVQEVVVHDGSPNSNIFGRHNSMPESPSISIMNKPSTSGMVFGRHSSMPYGNKTVTSSGLGDSPIRCSSDEIERKRLQAREKLIAKRLLPFTCSQNNSQSVHAQQSTIKTLQVPVQPSCKKPLFQPRVASNIAKKSSVSNPDLTNTSQTQQRSDNSLKLLIEKKRQEALMKLRRRQPHTK